MPAGGLGTAAPVAVLNCGADILDAASTPGDGALPEIPVNFIVIANGATGASGLPTANWTGTDPITGDAISGADYFKSMVDLLNQQLRADDGMPVCDGNDCLRLAYRSHTYYSSKMFESGAGNACKKLHAIASPEDNLLGESKLAFTENCKTTNNNIITNNCPIKKTNITFGVPVETRYDGFSDFAEAAVNECTLLTDDSALNVIIYDVCGRDAGPDGVVNSTDDILNCTDFKNGRARTNSNHPYAFLDYARALQPRKPNAEPDPASAEEHEVGHAFGLHHACERTGSGGSSLCTQSENQSDDTHIMQSECVKQGDRNLGFATQARCDFYKNLVVEVDKLVQTAREHIKEWQRP